MDDEHVFAAIADERRGLAGFLDTLTEDQWATASLCQGWAVRDVAAHLVLPLITPMRRFAAAMVKARGDFDKANIALTARVVRDHGHDLPDLLRTNAHSRFTPPSFGPLAPLTDIMIHSQDIRRPLGVGRSAPPDRQLAVLDFIVTPKASRVLKYRRSGVRWKATDLDWSQGDGPVVEGSAEAIMLTIAGRSAALNELSGAGVEQLG